MELNREKAMRLIKISQMYYEKDMTQSEIAKELSISRPLVCRLLSEARSKGIVTITINTLNENNSLIRNQLCNIFGLKDATIIPEDIMTKINDEKIGIYAAKAFNEYIKDNINIGLGWGRLISLVIESTSPENDTSKKNNTSICPLIGNILISNHDYNINEKILKLTTKKRAQPHYLYAPAFLESEQDMKLYKETENFKSVNHLWNKLDVAIIVIDNYPSVPDFGSVARYADLLYTKKAVGNILAYYFTITGEILHSETDYAVQIPLELLASCQNIIGLCPNNVSEKAILGALNTGLFTHIVGSDKIINSVLQLRRERI